MSVVLAASRRRPASSTGGGVVAFVHGFTQTRRSWDRTAIAIGDVFETITVDAPGHGAAGNLRLGLDAAAEALGATCGRATYVGYSMGGRIALHLAVAKPQLVAGLVLVGATPGIADEEERTARRRADEERARELESTGVAAFLDRWLAQPLLATLPATAAGLDERMTNTAPGLASSLRLAGTGAQRPLWDRLGALPMPVLLVTGSLDRKFTAIAEQMAALIPSSEHVVFPGAGHTVHLERPDEFDDLLRSWLARSGAERQAEGGERADGEL